MKKKILPYFSRSNTLSPIFRVFSFPLGSSNVKFLILQASSNMSDGFLESRHLFIPVLFNFV